MKDLKDILLGENLTQTERLYLGSLAHHDGFPVLKKLFDEAARIATAQAIQCDPEEERYDQIVKYRQQRARIINEFVGAIQKSFNANAMIAEDQEKKEKANAGTERNAAN
jgi:hypothetical protein